jgi:DNA-binding NarL/FixJ family response regulator
MSAPLAELYEDDVFVMLSPRQQQVCLLSRRGIRAREIARRLDISVHTVRVHPQAVYQAYEVHSRLALTHIMRARKCGEGGEQ